MEPRHLVVFLPGIGGSCLALPDHCGGPRRDASGRPVFAWTADASDLPLLRHPESLSVEAFPRLVPVGLVPSRKAFGVWTAVHGYDGVVRRLSAKFGEGGMLGGGGDPGTDPQNPNLDATFVAAGYDFRLGVADAAERVHDQITARVEHLWPNPQHRSGKVVVVGHSMGGLVARYWAGVLDEARWCRGIVTLGTPHRGAPKALQVLANGLPFAPLTSRLSDVLRTWQGIYDLLPRYPAVLAEADESTPARERLGDGTALLRVTDPRLDLGWSRSKVDAAARMHSRIDRGWESLGADAPGLAYRVGFGHDTASRCTWDGRRIVVTHLAPGGPSTGAWSAVGGDGTVPGFCAVPIGRDNDPTVGIVTGLRHGPMAALTDADALVSDLLSHRGLSFFRAADEPVITIGAGLSEVAEVGESVAVTAKLWRRDTHTVEPAEYPDAAVWASIRCVDANGAPTSRVVADVRLVWDNASGGFVGSLPRLDPGLVDVSVAAPSITDHTLTETLQIIDPEGVGNSA